MNEDKAKRARGDSDLAIETLARLAPDLEIAKHGRGWPAEGRIRLPAGLVPLAIYVRNIGRSGRNRPAERRFQNPANKANRGIHAPADGYAVLLGVWAEQGDARAVLVAMDAYRRLNQETRVSLFMPLSLLEEAADTGYAEHRSHSGEVLTAFRPEGLSRYIERLMTEMPLEGLESPTGPIEVAEPSTVYRLPIGPTTVASEVPMDGRIHIRPKVGMYSAFARLNYKPWFAIAEFVDNSIQSFLTHRDILQATDPRPLVVDIRLDEDELVITDRAGGISWVDFPRAFSPSQPPPDASGLSEFGLGMKAAACWFAREWSVRTSSLGDSIERTVEFDVPRITRDGLETLPISERTVPADDHYTVVTLKNLRVRPKGRTLGKIKDHLRSIYRVLMREGVVCIRLTTGRSVEELSYEPPQLLECPYFREPEGKPRLWRKEFSFELDGGKRKVWGWAGLFETGSASRAGLSVFRRKRLIQGSADETYRPKEIFRSPNSYTYQRLVGEVHVEGFNVSHTKDGIQWEGFEEAVLSRLKLEFDHKDLPLLRQAEGYRSRRSAKDLGPGFGEPAIESAGHVISNPQTAEVLSTQLSQIESDEQQDLAGASSTTAERTVTRRTFHVPVPGSQLPWSVTLELVSDRSLDWYVRESSTSPEERTVRVLLNLAHPFSEQFINDSEETLNPLLRLVAGLSLAEETARLSGVRQAGVIRRRLNELLRLGMGANNDGDDQ